MNLTTLLLAIGLTGAACFGQNPHDGKEVATYAVTQATSAPSSEQSIKDKQKPSCDVSTISKCDLQYLEPSPTERLLRVWQYQYQLLEQPAYLVATLPNNTTDLIPNPNKWLQQHSLVLQLSELFPRATNLPMLLQTAYNTKYGSPPTDPIRLSPDLCPKGKPIIDCIAGGGSFMGRFFSAAKVTFGVSQKDEVEQGFLLPNLPISQGWSWNGSVTFDPSTLFVTSASWKSALAVFGKSASGGARNIWLDNVSTEDGCLFLQRTNERLLSDCEKQLTTQQLEASLGPSRGSQLAAILIPALQFQIVSQFDFIKQGGLLTENPNLQRSLKTLTLTWDLRRRIPTTSDRLTIGALYAQRAEPPSAQASSESKSSAIESTDSDKTAQATQNAISAYESVTLVESQSETIRIQQQKIGDLEKRLERLERLQESQALTMR